MRDAPFDFLAHKVEAALQVLDRRIAGRDEELADGGFGAACIGAECVGVDGNVAHVGQHESLALHLFDDDAEYFLLRGFRFWQEYQAGAVIPLFGHGNALQ